MSLYLFLPVVTGGFIGLELWKSRSYTLGEIEESTVAPGVKEGLCKRTGEDMDKMDGTWLNSCG